MKVTTSLEQIRERLGEHRATRALVRSGSTLECAVALILHESTAGDPQLLFIERALRSGDPWSGHMAFPGGRRDAADADLLETARRETLEEVGFLPVDPIGRLDDFQGSRRPKVEDLVVGAYVFAADSEPVIVHNAEVASTVWVPLAAIRDPASWTEHAIQDDASHRRVPALRHGRYVIWGLTLRILSSFFALLGEPLPLVTEPGGSQEDGSRRIHGPAHD